MYEREHQFRAGCREVGDVYVGDTGWTVNCGWERVMQKIQQETCHFGADAAQIVQYHEPNSLRSSCYQVRARLMVCDAG